MMRNYTEIYAGDGPARARGGQLAATVTREATIRASA